jgi:hypothetical protein
LAVKRSIRPVETNRRLKTSNGACLWHLPRCFALKPLLGNQRALRTNERDGFAAFEFDPSLVAALFLQEKL